MEDFAGHAWFITPYAPFPNRWIGCVEPSQMPNFFKCTFVRPKTKIIAIKSLISRKQTFIDSKIGPIVEHSSVHNDTIRQLI